MAKPASISATDRHIARLRAAGVAVAETDEEIMQLVAEAETDPREIPLEEAFKQVRARLRARRRKRGA
ncbi:MAG: hypothetical protein NTW87_21720 [Planctomycetota bacterium]|nr:hypothetical protein [Planctomycetota bacterium]